MRALSWPLGTIPRLAVAGRFPLADRAFETTYRGTTHALHLHDYSGVIELAGERVELRPGDLTVSPAGRRSAYDLPRPGRHWCVHFAADDRGDDGGAVELPLHLPAPGGAAREAIAHIAALHARGRDSAVARTAAGLALQALLIELSERRPSTPTAAERAAAVIDERFAEPLDVPAIAALVGRSPAHLARAFRARYGVTVPHRLIARRVEHARYLLEASDLPIWRVAERVGIPDPQHFNKTVRRLLGRSPSAIRAAASGPTIDPDR